MTSDSDIKTAILDCNAKLLKERLLHGADIYVRDKGGMSLLSTLISIGDSPEGADIFSDLMQGRDTNRLDDRGCNILHYACHAGKARLVQNLLHLGADPACRTASGFLPLEIALAREEDTGDSASYGAIARLLRPLSPEPRNPLPRRLGHELVQAAKRGDYDSMCLLLRAGAPADGDDWGVMSPDGSQDTPLLALAMAGANGNSPLQEDFERMTYMLLEAGADLNRTDDSYNTPLHRATRHNALGMVKILLEKGADATAENALDGTPLAIAREYHYARLVDTLELWMLTHGFRIK